MVFLNKQTWDYCVDSEVLNDGDDLLFLDQLRSDLRSEKQTLNPWVFGEGRQPLPSWTPIWIFCPHKLIFVRMMQGWCYKHMLGKCIQQGGETWLQNYNTKTWSSWNNERRMYSDTKLKRYLITLMVQNIPEGSYCCLSISFYCSMNVRESHLCPKQNSDASKHLLTKKPRLV